MTVHLLDADVLVALTVTEHEHHGRASSWAAAIDRFAVCPVVEGALVRFFARIGETPAVAEQVLGDVHAVPGCEFWPDALSNVDADLHHVHGHRQVTDASLVSLVASRPDTLLAMLDAGLAQVRPDLTRLLPAAGRWSGAAVTRPR